MKLLDYGWEALRRRTEARATARELLDKHLDPLLKAADEVVAKIRSLAELDFSEIRGASGHYVDLHSSMPVLEVTYLFAQFWARIQILREESVYVSLAENQDGKRLLKFLRTLEARRVRLVDRGWQRGMGEALIVREHQLRALNYFEYVGRFLSDEEFRAWFRPLMDILERTNHTRERQRALSYGVVLHALVDTLDCDHLASRERPGWANKLSVKSRKALKFRVFGVYLPFVRNVERYYGE